jgi:hypothetical protein
VEAPVAAFSTWLDDFFVAYYRRRPVNATFIGVHDHDQRLPDLSEAGVGDTVAEIQTLRRRLTSLPAETLTPAEALDRRLAEGFLEIAEWEFDSGHFHRRNPSFYTGEAIFGVLGLLLRPFAPIERRVEAAIARLEAIPALLAHGQTNAREAPPWWADRACEECRGALSFLHGGGIELFVQEQGIDGEQLVRAAETAGRAFGAFQSYLEGELRRHPTDAYACGAEPLDLLLRKGHFLEQGAQEIEAYAREQASLATAYLEEHAVDFGARSWREALAGLAETHATAKGYYGRFGQIWAEARRAAEQAGLLTWPDFPIKYVPQPSWARGAAPSLYFLPYRSPAPFDDVLPVQYLVPPVDPGMEASEQERLLRATNDAVIKLNHVIHHGGIGHHVQNYHAYRAASRIGRIAAVDCASRIAMLCGGTMAEGWACYATDLMDEVGFLSPLEHYAEVHTRLRMATRALVDVRLHSGTMTIEQAAAQYRDMAGMAPEAARAEAVKNSMFPGAAVMYLIGTDLIHQLPRDLSARHGASFDLRGFHDRFLSFGSVPVALIGAAMREEVPQAG